MPGTFVFIHGTGLPDSDGDRRRLQAMLDASGGFRDWRLECPPWGERLGGTWGDTVDALPPEQRPAAAVAPEEGGSLDSLLERLAADLAAELASPSPQTTEGAAILPQSGQDLVLAAITTVIADHRAAITARVGDFIRNVFFSFHDRSRIRDWVAHELAALRESTDGPLVVAGHSLGGVIAVDALTFRPQPETLVVTAGSQLPLFATLRLAEPIGAGGVRPFTPWLNLYNPRDPLAFYASTVFPPNSDASDGAVGSPVDVELTRPRHLPESHTGYFDEPELYERIAGHLASLGYV